jgi:uracil-DNA glycosylase family 4
MSQRALLKLQREIHVCRLCVEAGYIEQANLIFHGSTRARVMVVGQAPGPTAAERPLPYSGPSGRTLRAWLSTAGFPEDALYDPDRFYLTSTTKCFPGRSRSGNGDRAPSRAEIRLCSSFLEGELALVRPELILALGRISIETFLPSLRGATLRDIIGEPRVAEQTPAQGALVLPLPHPSGVSRWHNDPENRAHLAKALAWLATAREEHGW